MPNNKDNNPKSDSKCSMGNKPDSEFEDQGKKGFGGGQDQKTASSKQGTSSPGNPDDDEVNTAGGREGQFSDKNRGSEDQWSPGSSQSSDQ